MKKKRNSQCASYSAPNILYMASCLSCGQLRLCRATGAVDQQMSNKWATNDPTNLFKTQMSHPGRFPISLGKDVSFQKRQKKKSCFKRHWRHPVWHRKWYWRTRSAPWPTNWSNFGHVAMGKSFRNQNFQRFSCQNYQTAVVIPSCIFPFVLPVVCAIQKLWVIESQVDRLWNFL